MKKISTLIIRVEKSVFVMDPQQILAGEIVTHLPYIQTT